jgi:DNA-binding NarL/FixJ family response regulator
MQATVCISDPLPVFRGGLRAALTRASFVVDEPADIVEWTVWRAAGAAAQRLAVLMSLATNDDWCVLDRLHDLSTDLAVVTLLPKPSHDSYRVALARGALSAAPRSAACDDIVAVVRAAVEGRSLLPGTVSTALALNRPAPDGMVLNEEERHWLRTLAEGASVEDLAWRFGYSRRTMYRRLNNVYRRLGTDRREGALLAAVRTHLI